MADPAGSTATNDISTWTHKITKLFYRKFSEKDRKRQRLLYLPVIPYHIKPEIFLFILAESRVARE
jgi:hypothetical protein